MSQRLAMKGSRTLNLPTTGLLKGTSGGKAVVSLALFKRLPLPSFRMVQDKARCGWKESQGLRPSLIYEVYGYCLMGPENQVQNAELRTTLGSYVN